MFCVCAVQLTCVCVCARVAALLRIEQPNGDLSHFEGSLDHRAPVQVGLDGVVCLFGPIALRPFFLLHTISFRFHLFCFRDRSFGWAVRLIG